MSERVLKTVGQLVRYGIVGLGTNLGLYGLYLLVTWFGLGHKTAMTAMFILGTLLSFFLNRHWTFGHQGQIGAPITRFFAAYGLAYLLNYLALLSFVDNMGYPHQLVQAVMIFANAACLFVLQKYWVFRESPPRIAVVAER